MRRTFLVLIALLLGVATPAAAVPSPAVRTFTAAAPRTVTLITGDRVQVTPTAAGPPVITPLDGPCAVEQIGDRTFVIPLDALPYLGRQLDASLFDISALEQLPTSRIPVQLDSSGPAPAGILGTGAQRYVTPASAREFGAALHRQVAADHGGKPVPTSIFAGVKNLQLAAKAPPAKATPAYPMHTLRIDTLDTAGNPVAVGTVLVINTDDGQKFFTRNPITTFGGEARVSVPVGHYSVLALIDEYSAGRLVSARMVQVTDLTVQNATAVTLDARKATALPSVTVPRKSDLTGIGELLSRADAAGTYRISDGVLGVATAPPVYVQPSTTSAQVGALHFSVLEHRESPVGAKSHYAYDVRVGDEGYISADQHYRVTSGQLATVRDNFYHDSPASSAIPVQAITASYDAVFVSVGTAVPAPSTSVDYINPLPDFTYYASVTPADSSVAVSDGGRTYAVHSATTVDWLRGPLTPGFASYTGSSNGNWNCPACRNGDHMAVHMSAVLDSTPGHSMEVDLGGGATWSSRFQFIRNGTTLWDFQGITGADFPVTADPADYRVIYDQSRTGPWFSHSQVSHTEWSYNSAAPTRNSVPVNWTCPDGTGSCAALPIVTTSYQLQAGLDGTVAPGPDSLVVRFGHVSGATRLPITAGNVEVSFDGGVSWTSTFVRNLGGGQYRARWTNPAAAADQAVSIRVSGQDAAGSAVTQTITNVATIPAALAASARRS